MLSYVWDFILLLIILVLVEKRQYVLCIWRTPTTPAKSNHQQNMRNWSVRTGNGNNRKALNTNLLQYVKLWHHFLSPCRLNTSRNKIKTQAATHTRTQTLAGCVCDLKAAVVLAGMRRMTYSPLLWVTHPLNGSCGWEGFLCGHESTQTYRNLTSVMLSWSCRWSFSGLPQQLTANTQIIKVNGQNSSFFHVSAH